MEDGANELITIKLWKYNKYRAQSEKFEQMILHDQVILFDYGKPKENVVRVVHPNEAIKEVADFMQKSIDNLRRGNEEKDELIKKLTDTLKKYEASIERSTADVKKYSSTPKKSFFSLFFK